MTLLLQDLRLRWRATLAWAIALILVAVLIHALYPSIADQPSLDQYYESLSPELQALIGAADISSPVGYLNSQWFAAFLPAILLVFAIGRGASTVAGEEEAHTLDLLLAQPVTRTVVFLAKAGAVAVGVVLLVVATWIPLLLLNGPVGYDLGMGVMAAAHLQMIAFLLVFAFGTQSVAAATGSRGLGIAVASAVAFVGYLVDGLGKVIDWLEPIRPLSPWRWYYGNDPLSNGLGATETIVLLAVAALLLILGVLAFRRRELRA
jgi:ABC-2 type transport system permease protein